MANLNGQNIGTNYKGILNLGTTINVALGTTLQVITDGDGNQSAVQISTQRAVVNGSGGQVALTINGASGANVQEWFDSNNVKIGYFNNAGGSRFYLDANNYISSGGEWLCNVNFIAQSQVVLNGIPTGRSSSAGRIYKDSAANILANNDLVVGIRV
jgi:hypothetical protein